MNKQRQAVSIHRGKEAAKSLEWRIGQTVSGDAYTRRQVVTATAAWALSNFEPDGFFEQGFLGQLRLQWNEGPMGELTLRTKAEEVA